MKHDRILQQLREQGFRKVGDQWIRLSPEEIEIEQRQIEADLDRIKTRLEQQRFERYWQQQEAS